MFCKSCGEPLPTDIREAAQHEHDQLVAEGFKALNDGRSEEALLIAQTALEGHPNSVSALSLKGMVLERDGHLAEALEVFERVVALNPDSALDKIKVQQLRNSLSAQVLRTPQPNRKSALLISIAATVFVVALGVAIASLNKGGNQNKNLSDQNLVAQNSSRTLPSGVPDVGQEAQQNSTEGGQQNPPAGNTDPNAQTNDPNRVPPIRQEQSNPAAGGGSTVYVPGGRLPNVNNGGGMSGSIAPVTIDPSRIGVQPSGGNNRNPDDLDPGTSDPNRTNNNQGSQANTTVAPPPTEPKEDPGVIEIKIGNKPPKTVNGGTPVDGGSNGLTAVMTAANQQYQAGRFDQAARSYERALSMGGDGARINQRLGQCYSKLGRNSDAIAAYRRAITVIEARIKAGGGNKDVYESQLESCRQALRALGG